MLQALFLVGALVFGACVGSFLNVVILRLPAGTFLSGGQRSHCPKCGYLIRWFDNVPILSWLLLRGRCRSCRASISVRYPLVEALTAALFVWVFWDTVGVNLPAAYEPGVVMPGWDAWGGFAFKAFLLAVLVACTFIDIDHRILPNVLTKPTMVVGLAGAVITPGLVSGFAARPDAFDRGLYSAVGVVAGLVLTQGVRLGASKVFGREAMGFGDVKFMGAIGAYVGWEGTLTTFFIGSLFGALYGGLHQWITKEGKIFFGPFLALGAVVTLFFKARIVRFVTVTWPDWQANAQVPPWIMVVVAVVAAVLLLFIIRRGRRHL